MRWLFLGSLVLVTLAGCGRGFFQFAEREPWRREAELACLNSGTVKEGVGVVRISPIDGPGICGADFPLKVTALGESAVLGFAGEVVRPPAAIGGASNPAVQPRWPMSQTPYPPSEPRYASPSYPGAPLSIEAPSPAQAVAPRYDPPPQQLGAPPSNLQAPRSWRPSAEQPAGYRSQPVPPLGPQRNPQMAAFSAPVEVQPTATLACPIVSALDRWIVNAVQPAAQKWFGQPVVEIKQISAYSCRGMNGNPNARVSEHAFGNALDIAAFVLADGRRITVKGGWRGSPEEQGFLRDVQGSACNQFTTVLAPGSNAFHYDHIHVDLMRRSSGRRICEPSAVDGEAVAARAGKNPAYAVRRFEPPPTRRYDPPIDARNDPFAWRGDARRGDPGFTGSIASRPAGAESAAAEDRDWVEESGPRPAINWNNDRHKAP